MRDWTCSLAAAAGTAGISGLGFAVLSDLVAPRPDTDWLATAPGPPGPAQYVVVWATAAILVAATMRIGLTRARAGLLGPAGGWTAGALVALRWTRWELAPYSPEFLRYGPGLAEWLGVGALVLVVAPSDRSDPARGACSLAPRAGIVFALGYGALWSAEAAVEAAGRSLPDLLVYGAVFVGLAATCLALGAAAAFVGPPDPVPQLVALLVASAAVVATGPEVARTWIVIVRNALRGSLPDLQQLAPTLVAGSVAGLAIALGAVAIWLRHRHHQRTALAGPA